MKKNVRDRVVMYNWRTVVPNGPIITHVRGYLVRVLVVGHVMATISVGALRSGISYHTEKVCTDAIRL